MFQNVAHQGRIGASNQSMSVAQASATPRLGNSARSFFRERIPRYCAISAVYSLIALPASAEA